MVVSQKSLIIGSSLIGGSSVSAIGGYKYSETTVDYTLKDQILLADDNTAGDGWTALKTKLKSDANLSGNLKAAKEESDSGVTKLKAWCSENYKKVHKTVLWEDKKLLEDVKKYCSYTFGDKIEESKRIKDDSSASTRVNALGNESTSPQEPSLKEIHNIMKSSTDNKETKAKSDLIEFCKQKYVEQYRGEHREAISKWCSTQ